MQLVVNVRLRWQQIAAQQHSTEAHPAMWTPCGSSRRPRRRRRLSRARDTYPRRRQCPRAHSRSACARLSHCPARSDSHRGSKLKLKLKSACANRFSSTTTRGPGHQTRDICSGTGRDWAGPGPGLDAHRLDDEEPRECARVLRDELSRSARPCVQYSSVTCEIRGLHYTVRVGELLSYE